MMEVQECEELGQQRLQQLLMENTLRKLHHQPE